MAMTYPESAALMVDPDFRGRVKVACLKYADYIHNEGPGTPGHTSRLRWAQQTFQSPDSVAAQTQPPVVMDVAVQDAGGAAITDAALQSAVEGVVNKFI
jgi:hypothetical protein